jgi:hypothetical protein
MVPRGTCGKLGTRCVYYREFSSPSFSYIGFRILYLSTTRTYLTLWSLIDRAWSTVTSNPRPPHRSFNDPYSLANFIYRPPSSVTHDLVSRSANFFFAQSMRPCSIVFNIHMISSQKHNVIPRARRPSSRLFIVLRSQKHII